MAKKQRPRNYLKPNQANLSGDLGRLVAEQDENLLEYYVGSERYLDRALRMSDPTVYFVGPKGIGKSAVLQMVRLRKPTEDKRIVNISPTSLAFSALTNLEATSPLLDDASRHQWLFRTLWDYVLALEILTREFPTQNAILDWIKGLFRDRHETEARKLLKISIGDDGHPEPMSRSFLAILREIELSVDVKGIKLAAKGTVEREAPKDMSKFGLLSLINTVAKNIFKILRHPYYILIDDLDLDWRDTPIQNTLLAAMFTSLKNFNVPPNLRCLVAIQERIYNELPIEHKDKFRDAVLEMSWDAASVRDMVETRLRANLDNSVGVAIWGTVFPEDGFERIWSATTGKPREAIRLASLCIDQARNQSHASVHEEDIHTAIRKFSGEKVADLGSEWNHKYPGLNALVKHFSGWKREFQLADLSDLAATVALRVMDDHHLPYAWVGGYGENPLGLARILLECQFFLYKRSRTDEAHIFDLSYHREITEEDHVAINPVYAPGLGLIGA
jgi:hypothetical protein